MQPEISTKDLRTLFRAREIVDRLAVVGLDSAIARARAGLVVAKGRRQYLEEILPGAVAHAVPGGTEQFVLECADERRFHLRGSTASLLWQIRELEQREGTQAIKVVHHNGCGKREYWL